MKILNRYNGELIMEISGPLADANLSGVNLRGAYLKEADLSYAYLKDADLKDADLTNANLRGANLRGANLKEADLKEADLTGAYLTDANLKEADLSYACLKETELGGADLSYADLKGADLRGAYLRGADLKEADLTGADLKGTELGGGQEGAITIETFGLTMVDNDLPLRVASRITAQPESLDTTTHGIAGLAVELSGPAGYALEAATSPSVAGAMLMPSAAHLFYASNEEALAWAENIPAQKLVSTEEAIDCNESPPSYDISIHQNPSADAWAAFFMETWARLGSPQPDHDTMHAWFSNAMMAMHDCILGGPTVLPDGSAFVVGTVDQEGATVLTPKGEWCPFHEPDGLPKLKTQDYPRTVLWEGEK